MAKTRSGTSKLAKPPGALAPPPRFVCIHGPFYQPPRENPWLETVEVQDSAAPYHDWNDRITAECYAPNGASRITNKANEIVRILNNYARISFNFGPTLLSWLAAQAPRTYRMIQDADAASIARFGGHGSAIAQVYNHMIMPLASEVDARAASPAAARHASPKPTGRRAADRKKPHSEANPKGAPLDREVSAES